MQIETAPYFFLNGRRITTEKVPPTAQWLRKHYPEIDPRDQLVESVGTRSHVLGDNDQIAPGARVNAVPAIKQGSDACAGSRSAS